MEQTIRAARGGTIAFALNWVQASGEPCNLFGHGVRIADAWPRFLRAARVCISDPETGQVSVEIPLPLGNGMRAGPSSWLRLMLIQPTAYRDATNLIRIDLQ